MNIIIRIIICSIFLFKRHWLLTSVFSVLFLIFSIYLSVEEYRGRYTRCLVRNSSTRNAICEAIQYYTAETGIFPNSIKQLTDENGVNLEDYQYYDTVNIHTLPMELFYGLVLRWKHHRESATFYSLPEDNSGHRLLVVFPFKHYPLGDVLIYVFSMSSALEHHEVKYQNEYLSESEFEKKYGTLLKGKQ